MDFILIMSVFWIVYGIAGILGFQVIPDRYKGKAWTREFIRYRGISWLLIGIPWLILNVIDRARGLDRKAMLISLIVCSIPSLIYSSVKDRKYNALLKEE